MIYIELYLHMREHAICPKLTQRMCVRRLGVNVSYTGNAKTTSERRHIPETENAHGASPVLRTLHGALSGAGHQQNRMATHFAFVGLNDVGAGEKRRRVKLEPRRRKERPLTGNSGGNERKNDRGQERTYRVCRARGKSKSGTGCLSCAACY